MPDPAVRGALAKDRKRDEYVYMDSLFVLHYSLQVMFSSIYRILIPQHGVTICQEYQQMTSHQEFLVQVTHKLLTLTTCSAADVPHFSTEIPKLMLVALTVI